MTTTHLAVHIDLPNGLRAKSGDIARVILCHYTGDDIKVRVEPLEAAIKEAANA